MNSTTDYNTIKNTSTIFFGNNVFTKLTGEDGALRKCTVDIFSERASMCRERQGAATGLAVSALNHVANKMAQPNNRPSKSNRRLERLERQGKVRSLTENEMALAKSIFGDNIDYQSVKIVRAKYYFLQSRNYAVTPNGNIYYPKSEADWTNVNGNKYIKHRFKEFLIHELTHVWQYQSGINVLWSALPLQILKFGTLGLVNPYTIPQNNMNFQSLNVEQQGSYMEGVFNGIYTNPF